MKMGKVIAWVGLIAMTGALLQGFLVGDFFQDGGEILGNPWGIVSLVDLYVGFVLFSMWIAFREKSPILAAVWIVLMMILGFFTGALYVLYAFYQSKEDWLRFFLGARKESVLREEKEKR